MKIPFCKPYFNFNEVNEVKEVIESGWWTTGKVTEEFEKEFAKYVGAKYCVAVTSCTAALFLSLKYLQRKHDIMKVWCPSLTFAATVTEIVNAGCYPVFGDVDENSMCLVNKTTDQIDAVIPVHLTGNKAFTKYNVPVIEDSAHLIERDQCKENPNLVCFSFYVTKNLAMGEGGAICTNDKEAYEWLKQARHHGISKGGWDRYKEGGSWMYDIEFVGWKYNPSDILCAIGLVQLSKMDFINQKRKKLIDLYNKGLGYKRKGLHLYPILVNDRPKFMEEMKKADIQCSVHFLPIHQMTAFKKHFEGMSSLPITEYLGDKLVSLPLFPEMSEEEVEYVIKKVNKTKLLINI